MSGSSFFDSVYETAKSKYEEKLNSREVQSAFQNAKDQIQAEAEKGYFSCKILGVPSNIFCYVTELLRNEGFTTSVGGENGSYLVGWSRNVQK